MTLSFLTVEVTIHNYVFCDILKICIDTNMLSIIHTDNKHRVYTYMYTCAYIFIHVHTLCVCVYYINSQLYILLTISNAFIFNYPICFVKTTYEKLV